jgi:hypothetical protein
MTLEKRSNEYIEILKKNKLNIQKFNEIKKCLIEEYPKKNNLLEMKKNRINKEICTAYNDIIRMIDLILDTSKKSIFKDSDLYNNIKNELFNCDEYLSLDEIVDVIYSVNLNKKYYRLGLCDCFWIYEHWDNYDTKCYCKKYLISDTIDYYQVFENKVNNICLLLSSTQRMINKVKVLKRKIDQRYEKIYRLKYDLIDVLNHIKTPSYRYSNEYATKYTKIKRMLKEYIYNVDERTKFRNKIIQNRLGKRLMKKCKYSEEIIKKISNYV